MKKLRKLIKNIGILSLTFLMLFMFSSCEKEELFEVPEQLSFAIDMANETHKIEWE